MRSKLIIVNIILLLVLVSQSYGWALPPVAVLDADPEYVADGCSVTLDGSGSSDPDSNIIKYEWDFTNDGTYDYNEISGSAGDGSFDGNTIHTYSNPGKYTAKLRVTDDGSSTDTDTCIVYVSGTYYVDPNGDDANDGLSWANAFATIQKGVTSAAGGNPNDPNYYDVIDVNSGTYVTGPITVDNSNIRLGFQENVTVQARSIFDGNDPNDPDSSNSFRNPNSCLFRAVIKDNIIFDGNDTIFQMNKSEYPLTWKFDAKDDVDLDNNSITIQNHGYRVGDKLRYYHSPSYTDINGLTSPEWYYAIIVDANTIQLASSFSDANDGSEIDLTGKPPSSEKHTILGGQWRMVISLYSCSNIEISNLTCKDSGGDGVYLGRASSGKQYCENITISNITSDNNYRSGMGVISVDGLTIENCVFKNTNGTPPECGIGFEPNYSYEKLKNIVVRNCKIENTAGYGLKVASHVLDANSEDIDLLFEDIFIEDCTNSIKIYGIFDDGVDGSITFKNVTAEGGRYGLHLTKSSKKASASFEECVWIDIDTDEHPIKIIYNRSQNYPVEYPVGIDFNDCQVFDDVNRPVIIYDGDTNDTFTLHQISGDLYVKNDNRIPSDPNDPNDPNCLYDWRGVDTNNVDVNIVSGVISSYKAYNETKFKWYSSIQSAIDYSADGDVIDVSPTTHYETIDFNNKSITLQSFDPYDWDVVEATIYRRQWQRFGGSYVQRWRGRQFDTQRDYPDRWRIRHIVQ